MKPWSAVAEYRLRRQIINTWIGLWISMVAAVCGFSWGNIFREGLLILGGAIFSGTAILFLGWLGRLRQELGEEMRRGPGGQFYEGSGMLANKPRSPQSLTTWLQHPAGEKTFYCPCQRNKDGFPASNVMPYFWDKDAKWFPSFDPEIYSENQQTVWDTGGIVNQPTAAAVANVDPGGGRWVILCPCGIGHYKLQPPQTESA